MFKKFIISLFVFVAFFSQYGVAAGTPLQENSALKLKFSALLGLQVSQIKSSPLKGIVEVFTDQGLFYASEDGNYLLHGKLFGLKKGVVNLTESSMSSVRIEGIAKFAENMIVFPAKNEKHVINVFTDITCGYCRKLHKQMDEFNAKGITVRYLAYPRSGIKDGLGQPTQNFKNMRSVWCSDDPKKALDAAFAGNNVAYRICDKQVAEEFNFGRQVGVSGTPAIVLESGMMLPGYRSPTDLLQILESIK
jgi:thiol:disulfide interchange protein DsbC